MEAISFRNDSLSAFSDYPTFLRDHQKDFGWLYEFLRSPEPVPGKTRVVVGESSKQSLNLKHCKNTEHIEEFLQESDSKTNDGKRVRLVLLCYRESWSFDRKVLKAVAEKYSIPPTFLLSHFFHEGSWNDKDVPRNLHWKDNLGLGIETPFLPSERQAWIELKTGFSEECLSALTFKHLNDGASS